MPKTTPRPVGMPSIAPLQDGPLLALYRDSRPTTFHSKAGPDTRLPFLEDDIRHGELEQASADLSDL
jgi:hypothetical protein